MTPDRFRACLALLHWSQRGLAAVLQAAGLRVDERQVRRWAAGAAIPERIADWLELLAACHASNPPPAADAEDAGAAVVPARVDCDAPTVFDDDGIPRLHYCTHRLG